MAAVLDGWLYEYRQGKKFFSYAQHIDRLSGTPNPIFNVYVVNGIHVLTDCLLRGADKSLARPGRKQAAPVRSVVGRGMDWFG